MKRIHCVGGFLDGYTERDIGQPYVAERSAYAMHFYAQDDPETNTRDGKGRRLFTLNRIVLRVDANTGCCQDDHEHGPH